jgi:hypothetical protein
VQSPNLREWTPTVGGQSITSPSVEWRTSGPSAVPAGRPSVRGPDRLCSSSTARKGGCSRPADRAGSRPLRTRGARWPRRNAASSPSRREALRSADGRLPRCLRVTRSRRQTCTAHDAIVRRRALLRRRRCNDHLARRVRHRARRMRRLPASSAHRTLDARPAGAASHSSTPTHRSPADDMAWRSDRETDYARRPAGSADQARAFRALLSTADASTRDAPSACLTLAPARARYPFTQRQIRAARDLRRPGGDRQSRTCGCSPTARGVRAADRDRRDPARDLAVTTDVRPGAGCGVVRPAVRFF